MIRMVDSANEEWNPDDDPRQNEVAQRLMAYAEKLRAGNGDTPHDPSEPTEQ